eukprot:NODE_7748_length_415_cov_3.916667_g7582_i0.p2 GENE.NODE_7748_length_415_cov_3.916667_g7582_i0~~NODE_7748_length_415_cov_3.916667_g7582_i0.p2  ORF type:complete len:105 (+),score=25.48 NODE_7748_length_415_cov_3.916667_g7582_i0:45-359(+)
MQIFVAADRTLVLDVPADCTVAQVKHQLHSERGFGVDAQRLSFAGKPLQEGRCLADYFIAPGSTLHLTMRLPGGNAGDALAIIVIILLSLVICFALLGCYARRR